MLSKKPAVEFELLLDNCGAITTGFSIIQQKGRKNRLVREGFTLKRRKGMKGSPASSMWVLLPLWLVAHFSKEMPGCSTRGTGALQHQQP